ncbi:MAG: HSP20 family molecular chaperone IbpA [Bacteriovoracaceae bacterium]|jgi:HSP20 family molecular chaperone IbpA
MKLFIPLFIFLFSSVASSQTREEVLEQFMKERKQMMEQMIQMFQDDFDNDNFFKDNLDPFSGYNSFKGASSNVSIEERYEKDGSIAIIITPTTENMSLDIQTKDSMIIIKTELSIEESKDQQSQKSHSFSKSTSTKSISIPQGYKPKSPIAEGKGIKILLVPDKDMRDRIKPKKKYHKKMIPIGKQPGEDTL